ncbi:MAG: hypothetical protein C5B50_05495 [Verrucomicrobia bacterium]|nr:MAG: hypothetical protein C5B50_05495 [Verrucomicrobiota bacterium]
MLRGHSDSPKLAETPPPYGIKSELNFPGIDQAFSTDERPIGITFYRSKESFFLPYHLLQTARFKDNRITLVFAVAEVVISGRGLHLLYAQITAQLVSRVVEQGERYSAVSDLLVHIRAIEEIPREK